MENDLITPFDIHVIVCNIFEHIRDHKTFLAFAQVNTVTQRCSRFKMIKKREDEMNVIIPGMNLKPLDIDKLCLNNPQIPLGSHIVTGIKSSPFELFHHGLVVEVEQNVWNSMVVHFVKEQKEDHQSEYRLKETTLEKFVKDNMDRIQPVHIINYVEHVEYSVKSPKDFVQVVKELVKNEKLEQALIASYANYNREYFAFLCKTGECRIKSEYLTEFLKINFQKFFKAEETE